MDDLANGITNLAYKYIPIHMEKWELRTPGGRGEDLFFCGSNETPKRITTVVVKPQHQHEEYRDHVCINFVQMFLVVTRRDYEFAVIHSHTHSQK